MEQNNR